MSGLSSCGLRSVDTMWEGKTYHMVGQIHSARGRLREVLGDGLVEDSQNRVMPIIVVSQVQCYLTEI